VEGKKKKEIIDILCKTRANTEFTEPQHATQRAVNPTFALIQMMQMMSHKQRQMEWQKEQIRLQMRMIY